MATCVISKSAADGGAPAAGKKKADPKQGLGVGGENLAGHREGNGRRVGF
jgi:hypothetical protein